MVEIESTLRAERRKVNNLITHYENNRIKCEQDYKTLTEEAEEAKQSVINRVNDGFDACERTIIDYKTELKSKKKEDKKAKVSSKSSKTSSSTKPSSSTIPSSSNKASSSKGHDKQGKNL